MKGVLYDRAVWRVSCAMRLLENDGQISPENMGKNTILAVLYLHIKWKYNAKRLSGVIVSVLQHTYKLKFTIGTIVKAAAENIYSAALKEWFHVKH